MIETLLSDRAEERRMLFEEAAGIGRYKDSRQAATRRLDAAEGDLAPGTHTRELDGRKLSSGVYYSRLQVGAVSETSALIHIE